MDPLVLAVPASSVGALPKGWTSPVPLPFLETLGSDGWLALPDVLAADPAAVVVELAVVTVQGDRWWCPSDGRLLASAPLTDEDLGRGEGLAALRRTASHRAGDRPATLAGVLVDLATLGRRVLLVYQVHDQGTPGAGAWVGSEALRQLPLEPVARRWAEAVAR